MADLDVRQLTYGEILRLDELLKMQRRMSGAHDEQFFLVAHQVYELWFKIILDELEHARDRLFSGDIPGALYSLHRVTTIERVLVAQVETLETISPGSFVEFRDVFQGTSGFQSAQFREIEFLSGLKDPGYLGRVTVTPAERARLRRRLAEPTLWDAFVELTGPERLSELPKLLSNKFDTDLGLLAEGLIGSKPGTGGSSGAGYLRATLDKRFFPKLWEARSSL